MSYFLYSTGTIIRPQQRFLYRPFFYSISSSSSSSISSSCHSSTSSSRGSSSIRTASVPLTRPPPIKGQTSPHMCRFSSSTTSNTSSDSVGAHHHDHDDSNHPTPPSQTLSVAIVGTGPSGCYTAKYLLSSFSSLLSSQQQQQQQHDEEEKDNNHQNTTATKNPTTFPFASIQIDMIDKLPTPFGLVRSGVAPDHPEVKNVMHDFSKLFQQQQQQLQQQQQDPTTLVEFWGNVQVGQNVTLNELQSLYHVVVLAYGCESDQRLGIEGEDTLDGIFSAREFVAWYNGHPEFVSLGTNVEKLIRNKEKDVHVVVIGQGNVALDCARVLAKGQSGGLMDTDIASEALSVIGDGVGRTTVLGRRGHVQGAFTIKELRELTKLDHVDFVVGEKELDEGMTTSSMEELKGDGARPKVRIDKLLRDVARTRVEEDNERRRKKVILRFLLNPVKFLPNGLDQSRVGSVLCEKTRLEGQPGRQVAVGTGIMEEIPADMVLVSIGYKGVKLPGMDNRLFDARRGIVRNTHGKVSDNLYVSGWLKRGPSGIIGTNIADAKDTVFSILHDLEQESDMSRKIVKGRNGLGGLLMERGVRYVDWASYQRIDAAETDPLRLRTKNQPREKITSVEEMLSYVVK